MPRGNCCTVRGRTLDLATPSDATLLELTTAVTLTPGDFAAVARRHRFHPLPPASLNQLVAALLAEIRLKKAPSGWPMGFV